MRRIYLAGRFRQQSELRAIGERIQKARAGVIVSTWLYDAAGSETASIAFRDFQDVLACDLLIMDTTIPVRRGGSEVELGIALGSDKEAWIVGPMRNIFHRLIPQFDTWDEALDALTKEALAP